jgi:type I restriction/modification enzyme
VLSINEVVPELKNPSKKLDPNYSGQYDFWYDNIRIEVKASRAVKRKSGETLIIKALSSDSKSGFDMNFQQMKPDCCDVFVWIAVWRDVIRYWVLSSDEVKTNKYYSGGQHRGNKGEGQLRLTEKNIKEFDPYIVGCRDILEKIKEKAQK